MKTNAVAWLFTALLLSCLVPYNSATAQTNLTLSATKIAVGTNIPVSKALSNSPHGEIHLAADPTNANNLIGASMVWSQQLNTYEVVVYTSHDNGVTWYTSFLSKDDLLHTDPAVGFGPNGLSYFLQIVTSAAPNRTYYSYFHRSEDSGNSWSQLQTFPMLDRHFLMVDDTHSKYQGRLYIHGKQIGSPGLDGQAPAGVLTIVLSDDQGRSFQPPVQLPVAQGKRLVGGTPGAILSDGTVVIPFAEMTEPDMEGPKFRANAQLKITTSSDGGVTFSKAALISDVAFGHGLISAPNMCGLAVDRSESPFADRVYAVLSNTYSGSANIMLSYSSDKGRTWSKPTLVNDDRQPFDPSNGHINFRPVVAVNKRGVVGITWYDRRQKKNGIDWSIRFAASFDGGETFEPSVAVSESDFTHSYEKQFDLPALSTGGGEAPRGDVSGGSPLSLNLTISAFYLNGGHTAGLAADADGKFHGFWVDNRTGVAQVWTSTIVVAGKAILNGTEELSTWRDISNKVAVRYSDPHYNFRDNTISVDARIENVSKEVIRGPLKVRVLSLRSAAGGSTEILNSDNGYAAGGAIWDFVQPNDYSLAPGKQSIAKQLKFSIVDLQPLGEALKVRNAFSLNQNLVGLGALQLVNFEIRVLAK